MSTLKQLTVFISELVSSGLTVSALTGMVTLETQDPTGLDPAEIFFFLVDKLQMIHLKCAETTFHILFMNQWYLDILAHFMP